MQFNNPAALSRAKKNIEELYPVVGVLERFDDTVLLMENKMPMFKGLVQDFDKGNESERGNPYGRYVCMVYAHVNGFHSSKFKGKPCAAFN